MSSHRSSRVRRRGRSGRMRALMSLGAVGFLAIGFGAQGTFAFWTDQATVSTGSFTSGTLDITLDGKLVGPGVTNNPGSFTQDSFALPGMSPGESIAYSFPVKNEGTTPLVYTLTGTGSGPLNVTNGMQYSVTFGNPSTAASTNSPANAASRAGSCGGAAATDTNTSLLQSGGTVFGGTNRALAVGATETVCIVARFSSQAGNGLQANAGTNTPTSASFAFAAKQVGAP
ncbi:MAG: TasA family protein [Herbiconiux sp.]|nr:TasA family protein [Herbiconiux sp.]